MFYGANSMTLRTAAILRKNLTLPEILLWKKLKDNHDPKGYRQIIPPLGGQGGKNPLKSKTLEFIELQGVIN